MRLATPIELARQRSDEQAIGNAQFVHADAQIYPFDAEAFDVVISRTGAMFFGDPTAAFTNISRALRPHGRLALLVWQPLANNEWVLELTAALAAGRELPGLPPDAPGPFSLADPARVNAILGASGFTDVALEGVEEALYFGDDADDAYRFVAGMGFTQFMVRGLDDRRRAEALGALRATIDAHVTADGVLYPSAAWIITARRS